MKPINILSIDVECFDCNVIVVVLYIPAGIYIINKYTYTKNAVFTLSVNWLNIYTGTCINTGILINYTQIPVHVL